MTILYQKKDYAVFHGGFGKTKGSYKYNSNSGKFGSKGKNVQIISSNNPIKTSEDFFKKISKGGIKSKLTNGKGDRVDFTDGTTITYRLITSTKGSKAVDIIVVSKSEGGISTQKIHFVKED